MNSANEAARLIKNGELKREHKVTKKQLLSKLNLVGRRRRGFEGMRWEKLTMGRALQHVELEISNMQFTTDGVVDSMVDYIIEQEEAQTTEVTLLQSKISQLEQENQDLQQKVYDLTLAKEYAENQLKLAEVKFQSKIDKVKKKSSKKVEMERNHYMKNSLYMARNFALTIKRVQSNSDLTPFQR